MAYSVLEGKKVQGTMAKLWKESIIIREVKRELYERVVIPAVVYGSETMSLSVRERGKLKVFDMRCLRRIYGIRRLDSVKN